MKISRRFNLLSIDCLNIFKIPIIKILKFTHQVNIVTLFYLIIGENSSVFTHRASIPPYRGRPKETRKPKESYSNSNNVTNTSGDNKNET